MTPERWAQVEALFSEAMERPPQERTQFLAHWCSDHEIRTEVASLLAHSDGAEFAVEQAVGAAAAAAVGIVNGPAAFPVYPRFVRHRLLGFGGFGTVYQAYDREQETTVAIKILDRTDQQSIDRFKNEFRMLADVADANLVRLYELFSIDRCWFFSMEFIDGFDFVTFVRNSPQSLLPLFLQLAHGVSALHSAGILHCDLKPSNVLVTHSGRAVVLDFGLVRERWREPDSPQSFGTPGHVSPEQEKGEPLTPASDWYAFGVILREALVQARTAARGSDFPELTQLSLDLLNSAPESRPAGEEVIARLKRSGIGANRVHDREVFAGREAELAELSAAFGSIALQPVILHVSGPPGIGKTSLLNEFLGKAGGSGALVLAGGCRERESVPFKAFDDIVESIKNRIASGAIGLRHAETGDYSLIGKLFPSFAGLGLPAGSRPEPVHPIELRSRTFESFRALLCDLASQQRMVVWIDDAQWADDDSVSLLRQIIDARDGPAALFVLSYRSSSSLSAGLASTLSAPEGSESVACRRLVLDVLTAAEACDLATRLLGRGASRATVEALAAESRGDPYLLVELARHMTVSKPGVALATVEHIVEHRVASLSQAARRLLRVIAVAQHPVEWTIARAACGDLQESYDALVVLRSSRLIQTLRDNQRLRVDCYHARVGDVVRASLGTEERRELHRSIAAAIEDRAPDDVEALARHYSESGQSAQAVRYAEAAGDRAAHALAFETALDFYTMAVDGGGAAAPPQLRRKFADALTNCGRALAAAEEYEHIAPLVAPLETVELYMAAALYFMASGHPDRGLNALKRVLSAARLRMPRTAAEALLLALWRRVQIWFHERGLFTSRHSQRHAAHPTAMLQLEACWIVSLGLGLIEPAMAAAFQGKHLLLAHRWGSPLQQLRAFALEAIFLSTIGERFHSRAEHLLHHSLRLAVGLEGNEAMALAQLAVGMCASIEGKWRDAVACFDLSSALIRDYTQAASLQRAIARLGVSRALYYAGEIATLAERLPVLCNEAEIRGDVFEAVPLRARLAVLDLITLGDRARSDDHAERALQVWRADQYRLQHYWILIADIDRALYCGDLERAWTRMVEDWPRIRKARLFLCRYVGVELRSRRALVAVSLGCRWRDRRRLLERTVRRDLKAISRVGTPWAQAAGATIHAALSVAAGSTQSAIKLLSEAGALYEQAGMACYAGAARRWSAKLVGSPDSAAVLCSIDKWMAAQRIINPQRTAYMLIPIPEAETSPYPETS